MSEVPDTGRVIADRYGPVVVGAAVSAGPFAWPVLGASLVLACLAQHRLVRPDAAPAVTAPESAKAPEAPAI
ncbi:hypothetical protein AB0K87_36745 [Streptomyces sp. NPDC053705]|uniref:hypothetical protein n=1 Tax=Streptomyces sp. NPDC053705 TaxID=3156668 RepID=UPI003419F0CD